MELFLDVEIFNYLVCKKKKSVWVQCGTKSKIPFPHRIHFFPGHLQSAASLSYHDIPITAKESTFMSGNLFIIRSLLLPADWSTIQSEVAQQIPLKTAGGSKGVPGFL
jgi:hypothetical protein